MRARDEQRHKYTRAFLEGGRAGGAKKNDCTVDYFLLRVYVAILAVCLGSLLNNPAGEVHVSMSFVSTTDMFFIGQESVVSALIAC